jgi:hypothetical protein
MQLLWNNLIFQSGLTAPTMTITSYSENPNYTALVGLNDTRLSRIYKSVRCTSEWLKFSFTAPVAANYFALMNHNLTVGATVVIQANSSDSWGSPAFTQTVTIPIAVSGITTWAVAAFSATKTYQYWRLTIADASNIDTYIKIGYVFLGMATTGSGIDIDGITIPKNSTSLSQESYSGQTYGDYRLNYRSAIFTFSGITTAQKVEMETFFYTCDLIRPFILLIWESDLTTQAPIYCRMNADLQWTKTIDQGYIWSLEFNIKEVF